MCNLDLECVCKFVPVMPNTSGRIIFFFLESKWMPVSMILIPVTTPVRNLEGISVITFLTAGRQKMKFNLVSGFSPDGCNDMNYTLISVGL